MPERVSAGSSVRATVTFVLTGLPSSFTSFEVVSVAPCLSAVMASSFVMPSTAARSGTSVFLAVAVVASSSRRSAWTDLLGRSAAPGSRLRGDQLALLEPLPREVAQRADQQDEQHDDGDEHAPHAAGFALVSGDLLLLLLFLLLLAVAALGLFGLDRDGLVAEQQGRRVHRLEGLDGVGVLVLVVAAVAEPPACAPSPTGENASVRPMRSSERSEGVPLGTLGACLGIVEPS